MIKYVVRKIFGTQNERTLKKFWPTVATINRLEPQIKQLSDESLKAKTEEFRRRLSQGETLEQVLPEAFAVVREAGRRTLNMRHFDAQLLGGMVLHQGKIAEMATGEGKTLVATLPVYLNALAGQGVHVVTVNDYLAKRDRHWMGPVYEFLGLTIGVIQHDIDPVERQKAYASDITYGTNNEYGFDYLRDNMVGSKEARVQRPLNYAIVDEVDSILIDEARTPLIISGPAEESTDKYYRIDKIIPRLKKAEDFEIDEKANTIHLTDSGIRCCEELLSVTNLYEDVQIDLIHHIHQALRAHNLFKLDVDYVVKENQVIIVDEFTGRLMPGRRFSDGLHQALEAKEGVRIERENQTLATVTFQNFFRMYKKLGGMTGTAETEAVEFEKIYKLEVVVIPTNRPLIRTNHPDVIYRTEREKFNAVVDEMIARHQEGRPCLVGTTSIEKSEHLSQMLNKRNLPHTVLNAKYHEMEAEIVARAGQEGAITIATNMAGRGTDILLGEGVAVKGGLHVIGTERHEARRIDRQLRGRSGRQGDPGSSRFFLALEDDLMRIFGSDKISGLMQKLGMEEGQDIQHPLVTKSIETAQKRVEARNFEIRKHLLEYDDVMNRQREIIYEERRKVLESDDLKSHVLDMAEDVLEGIIQSYLNPDLREEDRNREGFLSAIKNKYGISLAADQVNDSDLEEFKDFVFERVQTRYDEKEKNLGSDLMLYLARSVLLQTIDAKWKDHLHNLDELREGIHLRAYGQRDPLIEYKQEAFDMFEEMTERVKQEGAEFIFRAEPVRTERIRTVFDRIEQQLEHPETSALAEPAEASGTTFVPEAQGEGGVSLRPGPIPVGYPRGPRPDSADETARPYRREMPKVGRNDPCPCGSGKKFKKCCGA